MNDFVRNTKIVVVVLVLVVIVTVLSHVDPLKRADDQSQAEYKTEVEAFERDYESRPKTSYTIKEGQGINDALAYSGILPELGRTDSDRYGACLAVVVSENHLSGELVRAGKTIKVPCGTKFVKTAQK